MRDVSDPDVDASRRMFSNILASSGFDLICDRNSFINGLLSVEKRSNISCQTSNRFTYYGNHIDKSTRQAEFNILHIIETLASRAIIIGIQSAISRTVGWYLFQ